MRKITKEAIAAFNEARPFRKDNTEIMVLPNVTVMKLFGNEIAYRYNDPDRTLMITNKGWQSDTTKERLNAIDGVSIRQVKGEWMLNDRAWDGSLIQI